MPKTFAESTCYKFIAVCCRLEGNQWVTPGGVGVMYPHPHDPSALVSACGAVSRVTYPPHGRALSLPTTCDINAAKLSNAAAFSEAYACLS
jgi:hypothetical protein